MLLIGRGLIQASSLQGKLLAVEDSPAGKTETPPKSGVLERPGKAKTARK
jgi:hypothetical protein